MKYRPIGLRPAALLVMGVVALVVGSANVDAFTSSNQKATHPAWSVQASAPPCGDLNGDGAVNVFDAITLLQIIVGIVSPDATQSARADLDQNQSVNVFDAITLLQIIVGLIPPGSVVCGAVTTAPVIDLLTASDTGASDADDVTSDNTPTLSVTANAGVLVRLFVDTLLVGQATTSASGVAEFTTSVLADGIRTFTAEADDDETTTPADSLDVVVDTALPTTVIAAPGEGGGVFPATRLVGSFDGTGSDRESASYRFGALADIPLIFGPNTGAFSQPLDLTGVSAGAQVLTVTVADLAGNQLIDTVNVDVTLQLPFSVAAQTPLSGAVDVGVTFRPQVFFSVPVDATTLTDANFFAEAGGQVLPATIVPANDGLFAWLFFADPMPSSAVVEVTVDGTAITPAGGGPFLDADGDGQPGGVLIYSFSTVSVEPLPNTSLTGVIVDPGPDLDPMTDDDFDSDTGDFLLPIEGVEVSLIGLAGSVFTNANGEFVLSPVPGGEVKLEVNGMTATAPPADFYFPEMVIAVDVQPGTDQNFPMPGMRHMYLPRIPTAILNNVVPSETTMIVSDDVSAPDLTPAERLVLTIEIQPNSLIGPNGESLTTSQRIGISTVPPELVMDMLPPGILQHTFDITVQAPGISKFSEPVPVTLPNVFGGPPGSQVNFLSFDHTTGLLVIEGTMTVSADGLSVSTDAGTGVTHPGWHGGAPLGGKTESCKPSKSEIMVAPMAKTAGLVDRWYVNDLGTFIFTFTNAATPPAPSKDPCSEENIKVFPLVVDIKVDGPVDEFLTGGLADQKFELQPGQFKSITGETKNFIPGIKAIDKDRLYGVRVTIKGWKKGSPGDLKINEVVYIYRFVDAADDFHADGALEFADTLNDGLAKVQRLRQIEQFMHSAPPPALSVASNTHFDIISGFGALFDPRATRTGLSTTMKVNNPEGGQVGTLNMRGEGTPRNKIFLNKQLLMDTLKKIADGDPNVNTILVTANERALIDTNLKRTAIANAVETRYKSLYSAFAEGLEYVNADGADTINYVWDTQARLGRYGTSKILASDDGFEDSGKMTTAVKDAGNYNESERNFRLAQSMNQDFDTNVYVYIDSPIEWSYAGQPLEMSTSTMVNSITKTAVHEAGHTLGLGHTAQGSTVFGNGEVQSITLNGGNATSTFALTFNGQTTAALAGNATGAQVQTALRALANVGANINVAGAAGGPYTATFASTLESIDLPMMSGAGTNGMTVQVAETTKGGGSQGIRGIKEVIIGGVSGQTDLMFGGRNDVGGALAFRPNFSQEGLKSGLHLRWNASDMTKLFTFLTQQMVKGGNAFFDEEGGSPEVEGPPIEGPHLFVFDGQGQVVFDTFDFGTTGVDGVGGLASSTQITLFSAGSEDLVLNSVQLTDSTGAYTANVIADGTTLANGESVQLNITFDPLGSGELSETLTINTNAPTAQTEIALTGFGLSPDGDIRLQVPNNNAGGHPVGAGPLTVTDFFTLENIGASDLTITDIAAPEGMGEFEAAGFPATPFDLGPGASVSFDLDFDPSATIGLRRGVIQFLSNDPDAPNLTQPVVGTGLADVGTGLVFGDDFVVMETPLVPGSPILRDISDAGGNWSFFMPPDAVIHSAIFDLASGLIAHDFAVTSPSGQTTFMTPPVFLASVENDQDGDGLPDDVEFVIGTAPANPDTDGDGLSDFVEVTQGLDPFGGQAFPTGIIAALELVGDAKEVVVEQVTDNGTTRIAYVATGPDGLSLVDTSQFDDPILLSRIDLVGDNRDVAVDTSLGIAAVAGGTSGLHLVNVANTMSPTLIQTVALPPSGAARVEVFEGVAYVASGGSLISVDLLTGEILQTLVLGGTLTDVVREGTMLYTMDTFRNLRAVDISDFDMVARGSLGLPDGGGKLFAGNDIVYAVAVNRFTGGFATADVSDPDDIALISPADTSSTAAATRTDLKANGSSIAVLVGSIGGVGSRFMVMNVTDPAETNQQATLFEMPAPPNSVFIASGFAFVADGTAGLQVVNYLSFDNQGQPPQVTVTSPVVDLDPGTEGIQITEGASVPIKVVVTDDFQVRSVDLLVNGEIVGTDVSFPFDLFAIAVSDGSTVEVRARATDTGGNSALSNTLVFDLVPDTFAPTITRLTPGDGQEWAEGLAAVQVRFNEAIDAATVNAANFQLKDSVGAVIAPVTIALGSRDRAVLMTYPQQQPGSYSVVIDAALVTDRAGNPLGAADIVSQFTLVEASVFWVGSSGNWDDTTHWNTGVVPGAADKVFIGSVVGNITVTHRFGTNSVTSINSHENLVLTGGSLALAEASKFNDLGLNSCCVTLTGAGDVTVSGTLTWAGGTMSGTGTTFIPASATMNISGNSSKVLTGRTIENAGTTVWSGGFVGTGQGAVFNNTGTFDAQVDNNTFDFNQGGTATVFDNTGTLKKLAGTGVATFDVAIDNVGVVDVQSGTLRFTRGGSSTGAFQVAAGATLDFNGNTHTLQAASSVTGDGTVHFNFGTVNIFGTYNLAGTTQFTGGIVNFQADANTGLLNLSSGVLGGTSDLTVSGLTTWTGGTMDGAGETHANGGMSLSTSGTKELKRVLNNAATATWTDTGWIRLHRGTGAVFNNLAGATFDIQNTNARFAISGSGANPVFNNSGLVKRSLGNESNLFQVPFNNLSPTTVEVLSGTLDLGGGGASTGAFTVANGATLRFSSGTHNLSAASSITGAGTVRVSGGIVNMAGTYNVTGKTWLSGGRFDLNIAGTTNTLDITNSGVLGGIGDLTVSGLFLWTGGTMDGAGETHANGGMNLSGSTKELKRVVNNAGIAIWTGTGWIRMHRNTGAVFNNLSTGTLDIQNTNSRVAITGSGTDPVFNNSGLVKRSLGSESTLFQVPFNNLSPTTVEVLSGTLEFSGGGASTGAFTVANGATLKFSGGTHNLNASSSITGLGTVRVSGGTVNMAGTHNVTGKTWLSGGRFDLNAAGTTNTLDITNSGVLGGTGDLTVSGLFLWTGGTMDGTGTTHANGGMNLSTSGTKELKRIVNNAGTAFWTDTGWIRGWKNTGAVFNNLAGATFDIQNTNARFATASSGTDPVFNNSGLVKRSLGSESNLFQVPFNNLSPTTVEVLSGTLDFNAGGVSTGAFTVANGATLIFSGGTQTLNASSSITGLGTFRVSGGTVTMAGAYNVTGKTWLSGGRFDLNAAGTTNTLDITNSGLLGGTGDLTVSGLFLWTGGTMDGTGETHADGGITLSGSTRELKRVLNNAATATWTGTGWVRLHRGTGAVFNNLSGATFDIKTASIFNVTGSGTIPTFVNAGTLKKTAGTQTTFNVALDNTGTVDNQFANQILEFQGGGASDGTFNTAATAVIQFDGGIHTLNAGASITGAGTTQLKSGTLTIAGAVTAQNFKLTGGTLNGDADLTVTGLLTWTGGTMDGAGATNANGGMDLSTSGTKELKRVLNNAATATWTGTGWVRLHKGTGAVFNNLSGATFDIKTASIFNVTGSGTIPTFVNAGTLKKTAGAQTTFNVALDNTGTVDNQFASQILEFAGGGTSDGIFNTVAGAIIQFDGGTHTLNTGTSITGAGTTQLRSGFLTIAGAVAAQNFKLTGGTLNGPADLTVTGLLTWTGGIMDGAGATNANGGMDLSTSGTKELKRVLNNAATATWTGTGQIRGWRGTAAVFNNLSTGTFDIQTASIFNFTDSGTIPTFVNAGILKKTAGTQTTFNVALDNTGTVDNQFASQILEFAGGGTSDGIFNTVAGAIIQFDGGTHTLNTGTSITGAGTTQLRSGFLTIAGAVAAQNFKLTGGTLNGPADLTVSGLLTWAGGIMDGAGATNANGGMDLSTSGTKELKRVLNNAATATWTGTGQIRGWRGTAAAFNNLSTSTFDIQNDRRFAIIGSTGTIPVFTNAGTFQKTAGTGTTNIDIDFDNTGTCVVTGFTVVFAVFTGTACTT